MQFDSKVSDLDVFERHESSVRSYCRSFPALFTQASGTVITDADGREFIDFLSGAGTLNYGHNHPAVIEPVQRYLQSGGILHSLDMHTAAKMDFIKVFQDIILEPRGMNYKMMFPGPTGTNAIEAALKLARKVTGRRNIVAFSGGFHGMTLGALATTASAQKRAGAGIEMGGVTRMPYDGALGSQIDTMDVIERQLCAKGSGIDPVAAFLVETVQGEGGLNVARPVWLRRLAALAKRLGALLIIDDIQAGIGRTGTFFSFEDMQVDPDIVVLSKSLSGFGAPLSLMLHRPEHDVFAPGEHNGTFRGNNLGFVGAAASIRSFWQDDSFQNRIAVRAQQLREGLTRIAADHPHAIKRTKGRGMFMGLDCRNPETAGNLAGWLFDKGVIIETCGPEDEVLKMLSPLMVTEAELAKVLGLISEGLIALNTHQISPDHAAIFNQIPRSAEVV
ncbi:diaminobutyrate--2-oxoglutarate transaminase [Puniceibacterium sediminis]|uniref:Diaminobutyrate--2-oxoglutarate transaminase n=1 Tax=Puniceibacterium sediminis TaxID=1608407 RepID=A0A238YUY4_9RHOB|nr:diaminobutyrate--2-oxoglutarate transaminase [Puniceibacterium sediminis]SNR74608.1 diaminobutyrate aminotransferase apoenzyme [Puniceibacterium sediminis]